MRTSVDQRAGSLRNVRLSYAQIGPKPYVSVNTVKSNLEVLYRKLDATSRAGAVDIAAAQGLIRREAIAGT